MIDPCFLMFEHGGQTVCTLRWQRFSSPRSRKGIMRAIQRALTDTELNPAPWPTQIRASDWRIDSYRYHQNQEQGWLLVLVTHQSDMTVLIQFPEPLAESLQTPDRLLGSLSAVPADEPWPWKIFDLNLVSPPGAVLSAHEFLPGSFRLDLNWRDHSLTVYRFKPADVLLTGTIAEFGQKLAKKATLIRSEADLAEWEQSEPVWLSRLRRRPACMRLRLWAVRQLNGLLGVKAQGNTLLDQEVFSAFCNGCALV